MIFTADDFPTQKETVNPGWDVICNSLLKIDPLNKAYFILEDEKKSYVQCTGAINKLTIEFREVSANSFKHFVIGKRKNNRSLWDITWTQVNCRTGPINVHENEVLKIDDALVIFESFYKFGDLPEIYSRRNITKLFK